MYMGTAGELSSLYKRVLDYEEVCHGDDQCAFNKMRISHKIRVDEEHRIFLNVAWKERHRDFREFDAIFCGYCGTITYDRMYRVPFEYWTFFRRELIAILVICLIFLFYKRSTRSAVIASTNDPTSCDAYSEQVALHGSGAACVNQNACGACTQLLA